MKKLAFLFLLVASILAACGEYPHPVSGIENAAATNTVVPTKVAIPTNCDPAPDPVTGKGFCAVWFHWDENTPLTYKDGHKISFDSKSSTLKIEDPFAGSYSISMDLAGDEVMVPLYANKEKTKIYGPIIIRVHEGVFETEEYLLIFGEREYIPPMGPQG